MGIDELASSSGSVRDTDSDGVAEMTQSIDGQGNDISNLGLLSTENLSVTNTRTWTVVDSTSDTSTGSAFDYDSGQLGTTYDQYELIFYVSGQGGGAEGNINIRVNGISAANYNYQQLSQGSTSGITAQSQWTQTAFDSRAFQFGWRVRGHGHPTAPSGKDEVSLHMVEGADYFRNNLLTGTLDQDVGDVDQFRVYTDYNAAGELLVLGANR